MKLSEHIDSIRQQIDSAFRNRLGRMGISDKGTANAMIPEEYLNERDRIDEIFKVLVSETGSINDGFEKLVEEFTFTLFNRLAALKVMEAHTLHPEIVTRRSQHGDRSFAHLLWLEQNMEMRYEELEGLSRFIEDQFGNLADEIALFSRKYPYHLLPTTVELNNILLAFNKVENDPQVDPEIWKSDDVLGWLYESYNTYKKIAHKESGAKTEYNKVSIQSQVYTPRWVVKFLVDNSLGKLYLEMYPDSSIKERYKIANAPVEQTRQRKPLTEITMIDPAPGSGNFLLYGFDLFYDLYLDQIESYGAEYDQDEIPELIIRHNLHGIDLDDRAVQIAQLGLFIKAKRKNSYARINQFNVVSSDFFLPDYSLVQPIFEENGNFDTRQKEIIRSIWADLRNAHKFGSLIRLEERLSLHLHGLQKQMDGAQLSIFGEQTLSDYNQFRETFFENLQTAVARHTVKQGMTFLNTKTHDAIIYLRLITRKYDIACTNPPYTDSADFGPELKKFIEENYKDPNKFHSNLYASFIKRCYEITNEKGYQALIHPHTFMFIKTFEDVRKFIISKTHIDILVDYGLDRVNLFGPGILLDATWYVLSKEKKDYNGVYFNITENQQEKYKQSSLEQAYDDFNKNKPNKRVFTLAQSKLKIIDGWPFIYWISDGFREKFKMENIESQMRVCTGLSTANNNRFLRFWWEIDFNEIGSNWILYAKGGPYNKWWGNIWLCVNWKNNGSEIRNYEAIGKAIRNEAYYLNEGITNSLISVKGISNRLLPSGMIFDVTAPSIFPKKYMNIHFVLGYLNSKLVQFIADCLNPSAALTWGDIQKMPFKTPRSYIEKNISEIVKSNIEIKKHLCSFKITEINFEQAPFWSFEGDTSRDRVITYYNSENKHTTQVLINEAVINELIFEVFELNQEERVQIESKISIPVGQFPVMTEAKEQFLKQSDISNPIVFKYIRDLPEVEFSYEEVITIKSGFENLYQTNNDLEEFCIRNKVNPINVWYWFKESQVVPPGRAAEIALEFLADAIRTILMEDEDGIIPLTGLPGEIRLLDRLEEHCLEKGFTSAQFMQLEGLLGRPLNENIEHHFFRNLSDHLNLFMYLPKTPFIWHLSSGENQGFEAYIIIYKWNRDSLFKLKSQYLNKRAETLEYRQIQLQDSNTAQAQNEKEKIRLQLQEIDSFTRKLDELIAEGYNPILDDGVGKNIAPLQTKGLLRCDVLNKKQLEKYLKADW